MKKLSKILVIVLTLAMLLGAVVISAVAADEPAIQLINPDGSVDETSYAKLSEAINAANANTDKGDVIVKINATTTLDKVVTINRDADLYGKVIIELAAGAALNLQINTGHSE